MFIELTMRLLVTAFMSGATQALLVTVSLLTMVKSSQPLIETMMITPDTTALKTLKELGGSKSKSILILTKSSVQI